ncbi:MAG: hypothetical protein FWD97_04250 [Defluviitaleaceae bacterium]|nr:hypothetical protein [Defluviitaleaceae bacterium]
MSKIESGLKKSPICEHDRKLAMDFLKRAYARDGEIGYTHRKPSTH